MVHPSFPLPGYLGAHPYKVMIQNLVEMIFFYTTTRIENPGVFVVIEKGKKILLSKHFGFGESSIAEAKSRAMHKYVQHGGHHEKRIQIFCACSTVQQEIESSCEKILDIYFNSPDILIMKNSFRESLQREESELYNSVGKRFFKDIKFPG